MQATVASAAPTCTTTCFVNQATGNDANDGATAGTALATVSAALAQVSAGGTINVAAGVYTEQLVVNKAVTIAGAGAASTTIRGPANLADSSCIPPGSGSRVVLMLCGAPGASVVVSGVTISGGATGEDADNSCGPQIFGAYVMDSETLDISQSTVTNAYNSGGASLWGCQQGVGIRAGSKALGLIGNLVADHLTVLDYQKAGIVVDGPSSTGTITNSLVEGDQLVGLSQRIAMNGIQMSRGASGSIDSTTVSGNKCDDISGGCDSNPISGVQSAGILVYNSSGSPVSVTNDNVTGNDQGIYSNQVSGISTISGNTVNANRYEGIYLDNGSALVTNNSVTNNPVAGVFAIQDSGDPTATPPEVPENTTATLTGNTISGNADGVEVVDAAPLDAFTTNITIHRNAITPNPTFGVENQTPGSSTVDANCNWWGAANGPGPVGPGSGDKISSGVTAAAWLLTSDLTGSCLAAPTITVINGVLPGSAVVNFTPGTVGGPFTSFTATCTSVTGPPNPGPGMGAGSPITVTGLTPFVPYTCTVTESNGTDTSAASPLAFVFWPTTQGGGGGGTGPGCGAPTAPRTPTAAPGNGQATLTWKAPLSGCVSGYVITPYIGTVKQTPQMYNSNGLTEVATGLTNGQTYTFTVFAYFAGGSGPPSVHTKPVTIGTPMASSGVTVTRISKGSVRVAFRAGANNGAPVVKFTVTCTSSNRGITRSKSGKASPITVTGLSAGKTYSCIVLATNSRGTGRASSVSRAMKV